jgi:hypothetical protein
MPATAALSSRRSSITLEMKTLWVVGKVRASASDGETAAAARSTNVAGGVVIRIISCYHTTLILAKGADDPWGMRTSLSREKAPTKKCIPTSNESFQNAAGRIMLT